VQEPASGATTPRREQQRAGGLAVLHRAHGQRAQRAHADQREHPADAEHERQRQPAAVAARLVEQRVSTGPQPMSAPARWRRGSARAVAPSSSTTRGRARADRHGARRCPGPDRP
jgi:hypothetical protein